MEVDKSDFYPHKENFMVCAICGKPIDMPMQEFGDTLLLCTSCLEKRQRDDRFTGDEFILGRLQPDYDVHVPPA